MYLPNSNVIQKSFMQIEEVYFVWSFLILEKPLFSGFFLCSIFFRKTIQKILILLFFLLNSLSLKGGVHTLVNHNLTYMMRFFLASKSHPKKKLTWIFLKLSLSSRDIKLNTFFSSSFSLDYFLFERGGCKLLEMQLRRLHSPSISKSHLEKKNHLIGDFSWIPLRPKTKK